jgi:hypothetical protein
LVDSTGMMSVLIDSAEMVFVNSRFDGSDVTQLPGAHR